MKAHRYLQVLISVYLLLFTVNLWAEDGIQAKGPDATEKNTSGHTVAKPAPKDLSAEDTKPEQTTSIVLSQETKPVEIPTEEEYWTKRVDEFTNVLLQPEQADINALYFELTAAFDLKCAMLEQRIPKQQKEADTLKDVSGAATSVPYLKPVTQDGIYHTMHSLYYQRHRLLEHLPSEVCDELIGTGVKGVKELSRELTFLTRSIRYHVGKLPEVILKLVNDFRIAPLPIIGYLLQFIIALLIFRYWRRWAPDGLNKMRDRLMNEPPESKTKMRVAESIRYFDQVRSPIEWLLLLSLIFSFAEQPTFTFFTGILRIAVKWTLLTWFGILFIKALLERNGRSLDQKTSELTIRSLKFAGAWLIFGGLNLELISCYAGEGTLYAWVFLMNEVLLVLLIIVLLVIWKPSILRSLKEDPQQNFITEAVRQHQKGLISYFYIILGAGYLLRVYISKKFIGLITDPSTGQQVLDSLMDMEIAKAYENLTDDPDAKPIPPELEEKIMSHRDTNIEDVGEDVLRKILKRIEKGPAGLIVLSGEIGSGKTVLLQRVARESEKQSVLVSCPKEGFEGLIKELARKLHLDTKEPKHRVVFEELRRKNIEVLLIDNIHRLIRPYVGGQIQVNKLAELFEHVNEILCVVSCNFVSWQYIIRAREKRIVDKNALALPPWTTDHIAALVRNCCEATNIDPDFSKVVIPRQFDFSNSNDPDTKAFSGYIRMLHVAAMGNPKVALALWAKSLHINKNGNVAVNLPRLPTSDELNNASLSVLLVLRVIYQSEIITREDIVKSLQTSDAEVVSALRTAIYNEWVEVIDEEYFQINWYWRKVITRVLTRQNLMPRNF